MVTTMYVTPRLPVARLLILLLVAAIAAFAVLSYHAVAKHGTAAYIAAECADRPEIRMVNPANGRIALICKTELGWGIYIQTHDGKNVTAFIKEKLNKLSDVARYMQNAGYVVCK